MIQNHIDKVIFIGGTGRSGSTLLDLLLGQINGFFSTGELRFIWDRGFGQNQLCGCGTPFKDCNFWREVANEAFGGMDHVDHGRLASLGSSAEARVLRWMSFNRSPNLLTSYEEYFDAYKKLYRAIKKVTGCETIIDSSKNVAHGYILTNLSDVDIFTAHLTRDSRAVAYSWKRKKERPEIHWEKQYMSRKWVLKSAGRWNRFNVLAHQLKATSKQYFFLRYEDLAINPRDTLSKILTGFEMNLPSFEFLDGNRANLKVCHTVSGNPVRFERQDFKIRLDSQWQKDMAGYQKWLVTLATWPLLIKYGYLDNGHNTRMVVSDKSSIEQPGLKMGKRGVINH